MQDYETTNDENKNSIIETRTFQITSDVHNNFFDIEAIFSRKVDGVIERQQNERYVYDGDKYVRQIELE